MGAGCDQPNLQLVCFCVCFWLWLTNDLVNWAVINTIIIYSKPLYNAGDCADIYSARHVRTKTTAYLIALRYALSRL